MNGASDDGEALSRDEAEHVLDVPLAAATGEDIAAPMSDSDDEQRLRLPAEIGAAREGVEDVVDTPTAETITILALMPATVNAKQPRRSADEDEDAS
jgi:hypothetical protein